MIGLWLQRGATDEMRQNLVDAPADTWTFKTYTSMGRHCLMMHALGGWGLWEQHPVSSLMRRYDRLCKAHGGREGEAAPPRIVEAIRVRAANILAERRLSRLSPVADGPRGTSPVAAGELVEQGG